MADGDTDITLTFFGGYVSYRIGNGDKICLEGLTKFQYNLLLGLARLREGTYILSYDDVYRDVYGEENILEPDRCPGNLYQVISRTRGKIKPHGKEIIITVHTRGLRRGFKPEFID